MAGWDWYVYPDKQLEPFENRPSTDGVKTRPSGNPSVGKPPPTNKHINKETKITTTTEPPPGKIDFEAFSLALISVLAEMIKEGGWLPEGSAKPKRSWLDRKAFQLYHKLPDPFPADCAVLILNDWCRLTAQPVKKRLEMEMAE